MQDAPLGVHLILERAEALFGGRGIHQYDEVGGVPRIDRATMGELLARCRRFANVLDLLGVPEGAAIGTFAWNTTDHLVAYLAVPAAGRVLHTVNVRLHPDEIAYILAHAEDSMLCVDADLWSALGDVELPGCVEHVVIMGGRAGEFPSSVGTARVLHLDRLLEEVDDDYEWRPREETTAAGVCYTSGTTGRPKGVAYSHRSLYLHALTIAGVDAMALGERDTVLPVVPMFHASGWGLPYAATLVGASLAMPGRHLGPEALGALIAASRATMSVGVPTVWRSVLDALAAGVLGSESLASLERVIVGGSAVPPRLIEDFDAAGIEIIQGWGMTELSPVGLISRVPPQATAVDRVSIRAKQGRSLPGLRMRLLGEGGSFLAHDGSTVGELVVTGPWVTRVYHRPEAGVASASLRKDDRDWLRTGDMAVIDAMGVVTLVDRAKDLVKSGGEWISTVDLENHLMDHPGVREAAVVAVPDETWGERPLAYVAVADAEIDGAALRDYLGTRVARWQMPDAFVIIDEIPKTSVGKFDKKRLRAVAAPGPRP